MKNKNDGFTLAELIVSLAILLILASLGIAGILSYQDYTDFKRQNSYAQTLFAVAQAQLTSYSVRGTLPELMEVSDSPVSLGGIMTPEGITADESERGLSAKRNGIYCLTGTRETYEKYLQGEYKGKTDLESRQYEMLYGIFESYMTDRAVLSAAIALEYDPKGGIVYSVLYSDRKNSFTYTAQNKNGRVNICDRREDYRSEYLIGYYGLE